MVFVMAKKTTETKETNLANFPGGDIIAKRLKTPFANIINGSLFAASEYFDVLNPADETVIAKSPSASKDQVDQAVSFAQKAFKDWRKDKNYRKECIQKCADKLQKHIEDIALLMSLEQGKPLELAIGEVKAAIGKIISILAQEVPEDIFETKEKDLCHSTSNWSCCWYLPMELSSIYWSCQNFQAIIYGQYSCC